MGGIDAHNQLTKTYNPKTEENDGTRVTYMVDDDIDGLKQDAMVRVALVYARRDLHTKGGIGLGPKERVVTLPVVAHKIPSDTSLHTPNEIPDQLQRLSNLHCVFSSTFVFFHNKIPNLHSTT